MHNEFIKMKYCQCDDKVGQSYITLDLALFHYYCMKHVSYNTHPYTLIPTIKVFLITCIKPQCLRICAYSVQSHVWIKPSKIGYGQCYTQSFYCATPSKTKTTLDKTSLDNCGHNHFIRRHDICDVMDTYVNLEYKHRWDMTINIGFWMNANFNKIFYFQQEPIVSTSS